MVSSAKNIKSKKDLRLLGLVDLKSFEPSKSL